MTQATSALKKQKSRAFGKAIWSTKAERPLTFLYSKNNSPEEDVKSAIEKIEKIEKSLTSLVIQEKPQEAPVVILKDQEPFKENYRLLQQWEGVILEVKEDYFVSQLRDMSGNTPDEEAEIEFDEISERDLQLIKPGAFFYWNIGYQESKSGQRTRSSLIIFRRLPAWSEKEIERAKKRSDDICEKLGWGINVSGPQGKSEGL